MRKLFFILIVILNVCACNTTAQTTAVSETDKAAKTNFEWTKSILRGERQNRRVRLD